ncbi:MAG: hypothetical protein AAGK78_04325, partial [Planctomycetota bacterium]
MQAADEIEPARLRQTRTAWPRKATLRAAAFASVRSMPCLLRDGGWGGFARTRKQRHPPSQQH